MRDAHLARRTQRLPLHERRSMMTTRRRPPRPRRRQRRAARRHRPATSAPTTAAAWAASWRRRVVVAVPVFCWRGATVVAWLLRRAREFGLTARWRGWTDGRTAPLPPPLCARSTRPTTKPPVGGIDLSSMSVSWDLSSIQCTCPGRAPGPNIDRRRPNILGQGQRSKVKCDGRLAVLASLSDGGSDRASASGDVKAQSRSLAQTKRGSFVVPLDAHGQLN